MTEDEKVLLLKKLSFYEDGIKQHTGFREQGIALIMTLNGFALTLLLRVEDDIMRSTGCVIVLAFTLLTWLLGEKNLGMVIYYQQLWARAVSRLCPTMVAEVHEFERQVRTSLLTKGDPISLTGTARIAYLVPFRWIWICYVVLVLVASLFIAIRPLP